MRFNKFGRKRVEKAGITFDSKAESSVHDILLLREKAKELKITGIHVRVIIDPEADIRWVADFQCLDLLTNEIIFIECKGFETPEWRLKLKIIRARFPFKVEIWKGSYKKPYLDEIIIPKIA